MQVSGKLFGVLMMIVTAAHQEQYNHLHSSTAWSRPSQDYRPVTYEVNAGLMACHCMHIPNAIPLCYLCLPNRATESVHPPPFPGPPSPPLTPSLPSIVIVVVFSRVRALVYKLLLSLFSLKHYTLYLCAHQKNFTRFKTTSCLTTSSQVCLSHALRPRAQSSSQRLHHTSY